jgi:hypothetical protein
MLKAGTILLLVGAILHLVAAVVVLLFALFFLFLGWTVGADDGAIVPVVMGILYFLGGVLLAAGGFFGMSAWKRATAGQLHRAWIHGLVASLLPTVQLVTLLGAIFILVSPEHDAQERASQAPVGQAWGQAR